MLRETIIPIHAAIIGRKRLCLSVFVMNFLIKYTKKYTDQEIREILSADFQQFCKDLDEKGIQIRENSVKIHLYENSATASGTLYLNERITEEADTEILTVERKETDESVGTDD